MTIAADLDGNLWLCPACRSSLRIINWQVWGDDCEECHPRNRVATTEAAALELTGWSEERLLRDAYLVATESFRVNPEWGGGPLVAHVERRLGMRPPVPGEGDFDEVWVLTVAEALEVFHRKALPAAPIIDEVRVRAEHFVVTSIWDRWTGPGLWSGSTAEITEILAGTWNTTWRLPTSTSSPSRGSTGTAPR